MPEEEKPVKQVKVEVEAPKLYTKAEIEAKMREKGLTPVKK